jgi:hypothetical protein
MRAQERDDLGVGRKAAGGFLRKQQLAIRAHVEHASIAFDERDFAGAKPGVLPQRSLQPGSLGEVVSTTAVFDSEEQDGLE